MHLGLTRVNVRGQSSGNVATLASFILEEPDKPSMLLYLTGDKNRDTLAHILQGGGILSKPLQTYKTEGSSSFAENLSTAIQTSSKGIYFFFGSVLFFYNSFLLLGHPYWWIAFFAPSAAAFVTPILKNHFELRTSQSSLSGDSGRLLQARAVAIGPTTYSFLRDELHLEVDVTAQKPSPEDIVASITAYDKRFKPSSWPTTQELETIP